MSTARYKANQQTEKDVRSMLNTRRNELDYFYIQVFGHACETMEALNVPVILPRLNTGRQRNRANPPADNPAEYDRRTVYFPLVDNVMADLHSHFIANATRDKPKD